MTKNSQTEVLGSLCFKVCRLDTGAIEHLGFGQESQCGRPLSATHRIGPTLFDWHSITANIKADLYKQLMNSSLGLCNKFGVNLSSLRQVEILLGPLLHEVASRLSRCIGVLDSLDLSGCNLLSICSQPSATGETLHLSIPVTTDESYALLRSTRFDWLIEVLILSNFFGTAMAIRLDFNSKTLSAPKRENSFNTLELTYLAIQRAIAPLVRKNTYSISGSYLGRVQEVALHALLGQVPLLSEISVSKTESNRVRDRATIEIRSDEPIISIAKSLVSALAPYRLIEGFSETLKDARAMGYPLNPSVIFTSNSFGRNDHFKVHAAHALPDSKYIVGQHGNKYGTSVIRDVVPEISSADAFLSWGWKGSSAKVIPFGMLKPTPKITSYPRFSRIELFLRWDFSGYLFAENAPLWSQYLDGVTALCLELDKRGLATTLRLHALTTQAQIAEIAGRTSELSHLEVSSERKSFKEVYKLGSLPVFTYDSTGMLELAARNGIFFAYLRDCLKEVEPAYMENYETLATGRLLSEDPVQAADWLDKLLNSSREELIRYQRSVMDFATGIVKEKPMKLVALKRLLQSFN